MHLAVIIRAGQKERLPTAADLRRAGFAVSSALEPGRGADREEESGPKPAGPGRNRSDRRDHAARNDKAPDAKAPGALFTPRSGGNPG